MKVITSSLHWLSSTIRRPRFRWIAVVIIAVALLAFGAYLSRNQPRIFATYAFIIIWLFHFTLGIGAGYATLRLWSSRHHPLIWRLGIYLNAFIVDVVATVVLLFIARGVKMTWKFSTVLFVSAFISDIIRLPLIFYLIKGPAPVPSKTDHSGALPPQFWLDAFRRIVREEIENDRRQREGSTPATTGEPTG